MDWRELESWQGAVLPRPVVLEQVDSTNLEALRRLDAGARPPLVLLARHQTRGRGSRGRSWVDRPDQSVLLTVALVPGDSQSTWAYTMLGAVALCEALRELGVAAARIRWPNDVLIGDAKIAGVLAEARFEGPRCRGIALGIGLNVGPPPAESGRVYRVPPTSLRRLGLGVDVPTAALRLLTRVDARLAELSRHGTEPLRAAFSGSLGLAGGLLRIRTAGRTLRGRWIGLEPDGTVVVQSHEHDAILRIPSGHVDEMRPLDE